MLEMSSYVKINLPSFGLNPEISVQSDKKVTLDNVGHVKVKFWEYDFWSFDDSATWEGDVIVKSSGLHSIFVFSQC
jgi:hypothetical protein